MTRKGIYVNGKEIVARYVGDKLVWRKQTDKFYLSVFSRGIWSNTYVDNLSTQMSEMTQPSVHDDIEVTISKVSVGNRSWEAAKFGYFYIRLYGNTYMEYTRITFKNSYDKNEFQAFMNSQTSRVIINVYRKE